MKIGQRHFRIVLASFLLSNAIVAWSFILPSSRFMAESSWMSQARVTRVNDVLTRTVPSRCRSFPSSQQVLPRPASRGSLNRLRPRQLSQLFASGKDDQGAITASETSASSNAEEGKESRREELEVGEIYSNPVAKFLGQFLPDAGGDGGGGADSSDSETTPAASPPSIIDGIEWDRPKLTGLGVDEMLTRLDEGLREREWFVTGNVLPELFADDFFFQDPDVALKGIQKYAEGVRRLFNQETSRAEIISCELIDPTDGITEPEEGAAVVAVRWRLSGGVNIGPFGGLTIKPYVVTSYLHVRKSDGLVVFQEDEFDIPGWDILLSSVAPWLPFLAPPAPPISELS